MVNSSRIQILMGLVMVGTHLSVAANPTQPSSPLPIRWYYSYHDGLREAQKDKRPLLIRFTADWCTWCRKMDLDVFMQPSLKAELGTYTCIKVNTEKYPRIALAFGVRSLPRTLVVNTHDEIVGDWLGYHDLEAFTALLRDVQPYHAELMGTAKIPSDVPGTATRIRPASVKKNLPPKSDAFIEQIGHKDPAIRQQAIDQLVTQGRKDRSPILQLLGHTYLGVRIAAFKALRSVHPTKIQYDPWVSLPERAAAIAEINKQRESKTASPNNSSGATQQ
jgi:thioredoxin-like negative regulator of GroEL